MVVALIALAFSMTGTGIAARNMITGKQIENGSVTHKDLARNAVRPKHLAGGAVTNRSIGDDAVQARNIAPGAVQLRGIAPGAITAAALAPDAITADALAPDAVTSAALAKDAVTADDLSSDAVNTGQFTICPNGVIVNGGPCPLSPNSYGEASNLTATTELPLGNGTTCYITDPVPFVTGQRLLQADDFDAGIEAGVYDVNVNAIWEAGPGTVRAITVYIDEGPNQSPAGEYLDTVRIPPVEGDVTGMSLSFETPPLAARENDGDVADRLRVQAASCGTSSAANVKLKRITMSMEHKYWAHG